MLPTYARRLHGAAVDEGGRHLRFAVRSACEQREAALRLLAEMAEQPPTLPDVPLDPGDVEQSAAAVRDVLALAVTPEEHQRWAAEGRALIEWIDRVDAIGVLVIQYGYVNPRERRGFSIVDRPLPVVALNELDARTARLFTLMHELIHVFLAVSETPVDSEVLCNAVAAAVLLPEAEARAAVAPFQDDWVTAGMQLAAKFGVSREAAYRRMATLSVITSDQYSSIRGELLREPERTRQGGGPPYPTGEVRRLGSLYIDLVGTAYDRGTISLYEASKHLGLQGKYVEPLIAAASGKGE